MTLTANPSSGYEFTGWGGDLGGTTNPTTITMDGDKTVTAAFAPVAPTCYALTLDHTGNGSDPVASPANSTGCAAGTYVANQAISLSGALPDTGWQIASWTGTSNDSSTASSNTLTMPASAHTAKVNYTLIPPSSLVCESFNTYTAGSTIGTYTGWYDGGAGPVVTAGNGVASSIGLGTGSAIYNWTAHPFNWNAADFEKIVLQQDFQSTASGVFDDDRLAWTTVYNSTTSSNQFGVQLDNNPIGINTYWLNGSNRVNDTIASLTGIEASTWYRFRAEITKLTATSARIDVSLVKLDERQPDRDADHG